MKNSYWEGSIQMSKDEGRGAQQTAKYARSIEV